MDGLWDFFKEIKVRISSPLISSFILAWLAFNWRIVVALAFYKQPELHTDGFSSYFSLIESVPVFRYFWGPLSWALAYTFLFPIIRNCVHAYNSWAIGWGSKWDSRVSKDAVVSIENYYDLKRQLNDRAKLLNDTMAESRTLSQRNGELVVKNTQMSSTKVQLEDSLTRLEKRLVDRNRIDDIPNLTGRYEMKYLKQGRAATDVVDLFGNTIAGTDERGQQITLFKIIHLAFNMNTMQFIFILENCMETSPVSFTIVFRMANPSDMTLKCIEQSSTIFYLRKLSQ